MTLLQVSNNINIFEVILAKDVLLLSFKKIKENFDIITYIISCDPLSLNFGKEILDYFENQSTISIQKQ